MPTVRLTNAANDELLVWVRKWVGLDPRTPIRKVVVTAEHDSLTKVELAVLPIFDSKEK